MECLCSFQITKKWSASKKRQQNANEISSKLDNIEQISTPQAPANYEHIYQMYTIRLDSKITRDALQKFLTEKQIFSKIYFEPIHLTDFYKNRVKVVNNGLAITEKISEQILTLPLYPNMTNEEKDYLIESIFEFFEQYNK